MPKQFKSKPRTTEYLVGKYGFSMEAITSMKKVTPFLPSSRLVDAWARFLLKAESLEERRWKTSGEDAPLMERHFDEKIFLRIPKAQSYTLPGGRYTPDYLYIFESGKRVAVEVKGSPLQKGYRDARAKIRTAATLHFYDCFLMVTWHEKKWDLQDILPDPDYETELHHLINEMESE